MRPTNPGPLLWQLIRKEQHNCCLCSTHNGLEQRCANSTSAHCSITRSASSISSWLSERNSNHESLEIHFAVPAYRVLDKLWPRGQGGHPPGQNRKPEERYD